MVKKKKNKKLDIEEQLDYIVYCTLMSKNDDGWESEVKMSLDSFDFLLHLARKYIRKVKDD